MVCLLGSLVGFRYLLVSLPHPGFFLISKSGFHRDIKDVPSLDYASLSPSSCFSKAEPDLLLSSFLLLSFMFFPLPLLDVFLLLAWFPPRIFLVRRLLLLLPAPTALYLYYPRSWSWEMEHRWRIENPSPLFRSPGCCHGEFLVATVIT